MFKADKAPMIRVVVLGLLFVLQITWFIMIATSVIEYFSLLSMLLQLISIFVTLYLIVKDENPAYKVTWIVVLLIVPLFGTVLYLLIGNKRPARWIRRRIEYQEQHHIHGLAEVPDINGVLKHKDPLLAGISHYVRQVSNMPLYPLTDVKYYPVGEAVMEDLLRDLNDAKETIFIEFFIVSHGKMFDQIFEILIRKAQEGLDVRFLYDGFGALTRLPENFVEQLERYGIKGVKFNPVRPFLSMVYNTRDHRKFIIVDGKIGYTGGMNLADEYINVEERFGYWKDNMIRVEGPVVWSMTNLFLNMFNADYPIDESYLSYRDETYFEQMEAFANDESVLENYQGGFVQTFGDTPLDNEQIGESVYREILGQATDYVYIYTPYLVISYEMQTAMQLAAKRGVEVILLTPGIPDKKLVFRVTRSYYRPLLEAGVKIYEYTPGFLHAKTFVSDDVIAAVGTINLDYRSLYLHFESSTLLYYHPVIHSIREDFEQTLLLSREVTLDDIKVGVLGGLWNAILRLGAPLI